MCNAISYGRLGLVRLPIRTESQKMMVFEGGEFFDGETFGSTERLIAFRVPSTRPSSRSRQFLEQGASRPAIGAAGIDGPAQLQVIYGRRAE
jgi:hypothetical protein